MDIKKNERLIKLILWREILAIPTYTILFNYFIKSFWILLIIGRITNLIILSKNIDINELLELCFEKYEKGNKRLEKLSTLAVFAVIVTPILYILTLINNKKLFGILITVEIVDFIVFKLLDEKLIDNIKKFILKIKTRSKS